MKAKGRIQELRKQGIDLVLEVERLKRKVRDYLNRVKEIEEEVCEKE